MAYAHANSYTQEIGLILLGNSGVGKSYLANRILGRDAFRSKFSVESVTREIEFQRFDFQNKHYIVYNVPGLVEVDQKNVDRNRTEIKDAFKRSPLSIVFFVFGEQGGRIRDEDIITFKSINNAYNFQLESLVLIVNNISEDITEPYINATSSLLQQLTDVPEDHMIFLKRAETTDDGNEIGEALRESIVQSTPTYYTLKKDIELAVEQIARLTRESREKQKELLTLQVFFLLFYAI